MSSLTIRKVELYPIAMPLVERLGTSFGKEPFKVAILVQLFTDEGIMGWGESPAEIYPGYAYETIGIALHVLSQFIIPSLIGCTLTQPDQIVACMSHVRGHPIAKHGIEQAVYDAFAQLHQLPLSAYFSQLVGEIKGVPQTSKGFATVGVSIGIQDDVASTLAIIEKRLQQGYQRIKLKIKPGWDIELAQGVRAAFPEVMLMLDANSAYTLQDSEHLRQLDDYDLLMIEQPLPYNDIYQHSKLQPQIETAICLDESITTVDDAMLAIELGACRIINLKPARVGGFTESIKIYRFCVENGVALWIGGMLETGIGRSANLAFASLPGVTLPCDLSATDRYYDPDVTEPPFVIRPDSTIATPTENGIGVTVQMDRVQQAVQYCREHLPYSLPIANV
jgi:o-succinylbenzoate synthase